MYNVLIDEFEFGLEREYSLFAVLGETTGYLLANGLFLDRLLKFIQRSSTRRDHWVKLSQNGWRIELEYSRCLVEIISPPFVMESCQLLFTELGRIESWFTKVIIEWTEETIFDRIICTADYSVRTDIFYDIDGLEIDDLCLILLDPLDANYLIGDFGHLPRCFEMANVNVIYAGFTSTHLTFHPAIPLIRELGIGVYENFLIDLFFQSLLFSRRIEIDRNHDHKFIQRLGVEISPIPYVSTRDALVAWGDSATFTLLLSIEEVCQYDIDVKKSIFKQIFGCRLSEEFVTAKSPYSCKPRIVDKVVLFELRCIHPATSVDDLVELISSLSQIRVF